MRRSPGSRSTPRRRLGASLLPGGEPLQARQDPARHAAFAQTLRELGADVEVLSETPGRRLGLLLHAAFVTGRGAIVLDPATPAHRGEVEVMARDLTELGIPIAAGSPAT